MTEPFVYLPPRMGKAAILLSAPHVGIDFPKELRSEFNEQSIQDLEDTDWLIHELYDFVRDMGIGIIHARYSRYVIDLNRAPDSKKLYGDQRVETTLVSTKTFAGKPLYRDQRSEIAPADLQHRLKKYYSPYYAKIDELLSSLKKSFGQVLLYDAHSISRNVPAISSTPFPDLILGSNDQRSAHSSLFREVLHSFEGSGYSLTHNTPFKGGYITRHFGKPESGVHALQLERSKDIYLSEGASPKLDLAKAAKLRPVLKKMFLNLASALVKIES